MFSLQPRTHIKKNKGFSLIELMVTVTIMTIISTILLVKHSQFSGNILITNLAYEIALTVRQAQVYGLGSRQSLIGSTFDAGYGIHVESANPTYFIFFNDLNNDHHYDSNELIEQYDISYGNRFSDFCATTSSGVDECASTGAITRADISFTRPNPDAFIKTSDPAPTYRSIKLSVISPQGVVKSLTIYSTGQISVN